MDQVFKDLVDSCEIEPRLFADKLFYFLRQKIGSNGKEYLEYLKFKTENSDNLYILSLFYFTKARIVYKDNFDESFNYVTKAIDVISNVKNFDKLDLYFNFLSTKAVFLNVLGKYYDSFSLTKNALGQLNGSNNLNALCAFDLNLSYISNEFSYPSQALKVLENYKENRKYLTQYVRLHLSKAFLLTYYLSKKPEEYFEELASLSEATDNIVTVKTALLNYYIMINDLARAKETKDEIFKYVDKTSLIQNIKKNNDFILALARYNYFISNFDESKKYYDVIISNLGFYTGQRLEIEHEYIKVLHRTNHHIECFEAYEKLHEDLNYHNENLVKILTSASQTNLRNYDSNYERIIDKMDAVTSFLNDVVQHRNDIKYLIMRFYDLANNVTPGSKVKLLIKKRNGLYSLDGNEITKVAPAKIFDMYNLRNVSHVTGLFKTLTNGLDHIYPLKNKEEIVGYILFDEVFLDYMDDSTKNMAIEVASSLISSIKNYLDFEKLDNISRHDSLTGLNNRRVLKEYLSKLNYGLDNYIIELDLDDFKVVNDTYGHPTGDEVLRTLSLDLIKLFGKDNVFRIGGEEFIVVSNLNKEKIRENFENLENKLKTTPVVYKNNEIFTTISYGGTKIKNFKDFERAYQRADEILYDMKRSGKGKGFIE